MPAQKVKDFENMLANMSATSVRSPAALAVADSVYKIIGKNIKRTFVENKDDIKIGLLKIAMKNADKARFKVDNPTLQYDETAGNQRVDLAIDKMRKGIPFTKQEEDSIRVNVMGPEIEKVLTGKRGWLIGTPQKMGIEGILENQK